MIDNRGTGESDQPNRPCTIADMAADVIGVLDHARVDRAQVFGISMGGMIAQELALGYPGRVRRLVLGCTNCGMNHSIQAAPESVAKLMPEPGLSQQEIMLRALSVAVSKEFLRVGNRRGLFSADGRRDDELSDHSDGDLTRISSRRSRDSTVSSG